MYCNTESVLVIQRSKNLVILYASSTYWTPNLQMMLALDCVKAHRITAGYKTFRSKKRNQTYIFSNHMISGATEKYKGNSNQ